MLKGKNDNCNSCDKNRAIEVFDLEKIRNLKKPESKEVLNKTEINTNKISASQIPLLKSNGTISNGEKLQ